MPLTPSQVRKNRDRLAKLTPEQILKMHEIECEAFANFHGTIGEFEGAVGMMHLGYQIGWKPLVLLHNKRTIRTYEEILGINVREMFEPEGPGADRSRGYMIAKKLSNFWRAVSGDDKNEELKAVRREIA